MMTSIHELLQKEAQAVLNIPITDAYEKAVELIVEQIHRKKGKLVTTGMGKAGQIAMNIATTFCSTGIPAVFLHPSEAQHGDLGILQENDLLLLISNSGKTREIVELTQLAHNLDRKSTRLNSSHDQMSYAVFCLKKKKKITLRVKMQKKISNI